MVKVIIWIPPYWIERADGRSTSALFIYLKRIFTCATNEDRIEYKRKYTEAKEILTWH